MTQTAMNNARVLYELSISRECIENAESIYSMESGLSKVLEDPTLLAEEKTRIIGRVFTEPEFPVLFTNFLKVTCNHGQIDQLRDIFTAYYEYWDVKNDILRVECVYFKEIEDDVMADIKGYLTKKYPEKKLIYHVVVDPEILGGVVIKVGNEEYDWSYEGKFRQLERILTGR